MGVVFSGFPALSQPLTLQGPDFLTLPNQPVYLRAQLNIGLPLAFQRDVSNAEISFYLGDKLLGTDRTSREGRAVLRKFAPEVGEYLIRLFFPGNKQFEEAESSLRLFVVDRRTSILVTEVDGVLAQTRSMADIRSGQENPQPIIWAASVLRSLISQSDYTIVYLTSREDRLKNWTQDWLQDHGFPSGPLFLWDQFDSPLSPYPSKAGCLKRFKEQWPHIRWGIGTCVEDMKVYQAQNVQSIWLSDQKPEALPEGAHWAPDWRKIEKLIESGP